MSNNYILFCHYRSELTTTSALTTTSCFVITDPNYFVGQEKMAYSDAKDYCEAQGATLARMYSAEENDRVAQLVTATGRGTLDQGLGGFWFDTTDEVEVLYSHSTNSCDNLHVLSRTGYAPVSQSQRHAKNRLFLFVSHMQNVTCCATKPHAMRPLGECFVGTF